MKRLQKKELNNFLSGAMKTYGLIAPVKLERENASVFRNIKDASEIVLDYRNTKKSVKEVFFPQEETMFIFKKNEEGSIKKPEARGETILFGVRSCDLKGIEIFDNVFATGEFIDPYYKEKRDNTIIVGFGCFDSAEYCFCESMGINKLANPIADAFIYDLGEEYIIDVKTSKGEKLFSSLPDAGDELVKVYEKKKADSPAQEKMDIQKFEKIIDDHFDNPIWEEVSQKCIGCSICAYLCPTCHCFDVTDEVVKGTGRRYRTWDACMFSKFTLHTSGHNPRTKNSQRMRQRILHKFNYLEKNKNVLACSGCGRCIVNCPVNLDIREIIKTILKDSEIKAE